MPRGKLGAAPGEQSIWVTLQKIAVTCGIEPAPMEKPMSNFREAIRIDQHEAIHKDAAGMAREPGVFWACELIAGHGEKNQKKYHHQPALWRVVEHLPHARQ